MKMQYIRTVPVSFTQFLNESNSVHLTINDITKLDSNKKIKILCIDRNIYDLIDMNKSNKSYKINKFFENAYQGIYIHDNNLQGMFLFNNDTEPQNFEFHIEWIPDHWYPLRNGILKSDEQFTFPVEFEGKSWKEFPLNTRIGWRGPMIQKKYLKYFPLIYKEN